MVPVRGPAYLVGPSWSSTVEQTQACAILKINLPIDEAGLKSAFRRRSHETHPDQGGASEDFIAVNSAYEVLKSIVGSNSIFAHDLTGTTSCGRPLTDLGKGLPVTQSAYTCDKCRGAGYTTERSGVRGDCRACQGQGIYTTLSRRCDCSAWPPRYCKRCRGAGWYVWLQLKQPHICKPCNGTGFTSKITQQVHNFCHACKGTGEIAVWNPVLPRGRLV